MIKISLGTDRDSREAEMLRVIDKWCDMPERIFVLTPSQTTFSTSRNILLNLGNTRTADKLRVVDFERAGEVYYGECGGSKTVMDNGGRLLAMTLACHNVKKSLEYYTKSIERVETVKAILSLYDRITYSDRAWEEVVASAAAIGERNPMLLKKVSDLTQIFGEYEKICDGSELDPSNAQSILADNIGASDWLVNTRWFVIGYTDFTKPQRSVLSKIMNMAKDCVIQLPLNGKADDRACARIARGTLGKLQEMAECRIHVLPENKSKNLAMRTLQNNLCEEEPITDDMDTPDAGKHIRLWCDRTPHAEVTHAAGAILRAIRSGYRYSDISVVLCQYDRYAPIFRSVCKKYGIPVYMSSEKDEVSKKQAMLAVYKALDSATHGMQLEDVIQYLKTGMTSLTMEETDRLENYIRTWNIHGRGFEPDDDVWLMHPDGYGKEADEASDCVLEAINAARRVAINPLVELRDKLSEGTTVKDHTQALYDFLTKTEFYEKLQYMADTMLENEETQQAAEIVQLSDIINGGLEQMYGVVGECEKNGNEFNKLFRTLCAAYRIKTIPVALDQTEVFNIMDARYSSTKLRIILGAEEGHFPVYPDSGSAILSDMDIIDLAQEDCYIDGSSRELADRSLLDVETILSGAQHGIVFSYASDAMNPSVPSYLYTRVGKMFPSLTIESGDGENHIFGADLMVAEQAGKLIGRLSKDAAYDAITMSLATLDNDTLQAVGFRMIEKAAWELGDLTEKTVKGVHGAVLPLSATRVDAYSSCRYHYFLRYGLRLKEPPVGRMNSPAFGAFVHSVLEKSAREIETEYGGFATAKDADIIAVVKKHIDAYTAMRMKGLDKQPERYQYLYKRNVREIMNIMHNICAEFRVSDFRSTGWEIKVGGEDADLPPISVDGKKMRGLFTGIIDRIDECAVDGKHYVRLADYKTGKTKTFDRDDILVGQSLQLLIYQAAIRASIGTESAGVLYVPAKEIIVSTPTKVSEEKVEKEREKALERHGVILNDKAVIAAMEHTDDGKCKFLPIRYAADGSVVGDVATKEQLAALDAYAIRRMSEMVEDVASGAVSANPLSRGMDRNACTYCPHKSACHKDICHTRFRYRKHVTDEEFWKEICG